VKALSSRKLAVAAVGLVLLGGGAAAVAATHSSSGLGRQGYIDDLAKHLGVSPGALAAAMRAAGDEQIEAAVAAGRITQSQADVLKQRAGRRGGAPLLGYGFAAGRLGPGGAAAQYLGINRATLRSERLSGKSLAQIASSTPGKSAEGLKAALVSAGQTRLREADSSGLITSEQEQERLGALPDRVEALVNRTGVGGRHR